MVDRTPIKKIKTPGRSKRRAETLKRQTKNRSVTLGDARKDPYTSINRLYKNFKKIHIPKNTYNLGTVTNVNNRYLSVRMSRKLVDNLKDIYVNKSLRNQAEYVGVIQFTLKNTRNYVKFHSPTARTNHNYTVVQPTMNEFKQYIMYHTHTVPPNNNRNLFTYPSPGDIRAYIGSYPQLQANLILENNGYYIIDLLETDMRIPNPSVVNPFFIGLINESGFANVRTGYRGLAYVETNSSNWKRFINRYIDPIMRRQFGISIKYYSWNELGKITLLDKNVIMNQG